MSERAAIVTGASSGIGLAIAHVLGEEGHGLTVAARRPEKLEQAAAELRDAGYDVEAVAANLVSEDDVQRVVQAHQARFGRLVAPEQMIRTEDIAEAVRFLLRLSPNCVVPEIVFQRATESL
jgi:NADP-dependent 3-hydroxy acid dehydrogenase YdfG